MNTRDLKPVKREPIKRDQAKERYDWFAEYLRETCGVEWDPGLELLAPDTRKAKR